MQAQHDTAGEAYSALRHGLLQKLRALEICCSTAELLAHPGYLEIASAVEQVLRTPHISDHRPHDAPAKHRYRIVAWNIERGARFDGQLRVLREHPYLREADVLLITEADAGMARSGNRMVAEVLAQELGMAQAFAPCYIALGKGSGVERDTQGDNEYALHGNAILSRYPLHDVRVIPLENGVDKFAHREKRVGRQAAIAARIEFPNLSLETVSIHLDAQSTQRHRQDQMRVVLDAANSAGPAIIGGDWNTSTYDSSHAAYAIAGFWRRVFMGVDHVIRNHYLHPDRWFERGLFRLIERRGFDYRGANVAGEYTTYYDVHDLRSVRNLNEWVPAWCFAFIRWALRNHGGRCPLKLDWIAAREVRVMEPRVIHDLRDQTGHALSDHDPVGVDVLA